MKYKVGDKVKIREDLIIGKYYGGESFVPEMAKFRGKIVTIRDIDCGEYTIEEHKFGWHWSDEMIKCKVYKEEVTFKGNKTIFKTENGKEIVSKCDENDKFDKEKGVLMCIAKKAGYEYQDIKNLVENSKTEQETITLTEFLESDKLMVIRCKTELEFYKVAMACKEKERFKAPNFIAKIIDGKKYRTMGIDNFKKTFSNFAGEYWYERNFLKDELKMFDFNQVDLTK